MSDQEQNVDTSVETPPPQEKETPTEPSTIEKQAREMGWLPKEEFNGDPEKWVSDEIFVARAPLIERIERQSRELKQVKAVLDDLTKHHKRVAESEYNRALNTLKSQRKAALEQEDFKAAEELRDQMDELREAKAAQPEVPQVTDNRAEIQAVYNSWVVKNQWYTTDPALAKKADTLGAGYAAQGLSMEEVLTNVTDDIKKLFPEKFQTKRASAPTVESGTQRKSSGKSDLVLTAEERRAMNRFVQQGVMTEKEYLDEIRTMREQE